MKSTTKQLSNLQKVSVTGKVTATPTGEASPTNVPEDSFVTLSEKDFPGAVLPLQKECKDKKIQLIKPFITPLMGSLKMTGKPITVTLKDINYWSFSTSATTVTHILGPRVQTIIDFDNFGNCYDEYKIVDYKVEMNLRNMYGDTTARSVLVCYDRHNQTITSQDVAVGYQNMKWFIPTSGIHKFEYKVPKVLCSNNSTGDYVPSWQPCSENGDFNYGTISLVPYPSLTAYFIVTYVEYYTVSFRMRR